MNNEVKKYLAFGGLGLLIVVTFFLVLPHCAKAQGYSSYSSSNPQQECAKVDADFQKWTTDHMAKYKDNMAKARDPFERQEVQLRHDFDYNMENLKKEKRKWEINNPRR